MKKEIYAGIALGILVGGIVGLSIAQVTGIILGALASLLAAFFGLRPNKEGETGNQIIIGTFSIVCAVAVIGGIYIRANNLISPSLDKEINLYKKAKFTESEIKQIILIKKLGIIPSGYNFNPNAKSVSDLSVLMSAENEVLFLCNEITNDSSLEDIKSAFKDSGGKYHRAQQEMEALISDEIELKKALILIKRLICES